MTCDQMTKLARNLVESIQAQPNDDMRVQVAELVLRGVYEDGVDEGTFINSSGTKLR